MFRSETFKALVETVAEAVGYIALFILPVAACVVYSLHSACLLS